MVLTRSRSSDFDMVCASVELRSGLNVHAVSVRNLTRLLRVRVAAGRSTQIVTVNPEIDQTTLDDGAYAQAVYESDVRICDGVGIQIAARLRRLLVPPRATGVALTQDLMDIAAKEKMSVMTIGAENRVRERFESQLREKGVDVALGTSAVVRSVPEFADQLAPQICDGQIVLVALGVPKQELLIRELRKRTSAAAIYIGVGGTVDYLAGEVPHAPDWVRRLGFEWLFRLALQPGKRLRRQMRTLPRFAVRELSGALMARWTLS